MSLKLGVIGYPLKHTLSPAIQTAALKALGIDATYDAYETPPEALAGFLAQLRGPEWLGLNVTLPHKQAAMAALDEISDEAQAIGAINTVHHDGAKLKGYNTDAPAFLQDLEDAFGPTTGKRIAVLGAGGASRAICYALRQGPEVVWLWNRHPERAREIAARCGGVIQVSETLGVLGDADVLVNCTSAGLHADESPIADEDVPEGKFLYDLIYNPPTTRLMGVAEQRGGRAVNGLGMLVRQAAIALKIWTGQTPPLDVMFEAARHQLSGTAGR